MKRTLLLGVVLAFGATMAPAAANTDYVAPPPDPGYEYIFDGTATGSPASFDQWEYGSSTAAASVTQNFFTLEAEHGAIDPNNSAFGGFWYPVRPFGDAVLKLKYTVEDIPTSTRNGGIMIRSPEVRYTGADNTAVLAQKPIGYNFDVCPGAIPVCGRETPAASTTYSWKGADGPFPPASDASSPPFLYEGPYCARASNTVTPTLLANIMNLAGTGFLSHGGNANNNRHWVQVYCGHEIQINETLTGGGPNPSSDPIKTGSVYGFRNLNAQQSKTYERLEKGVWHDMEIRMIGQQYTILVDGEIINQFDNGVPKIASRNGDPATVARQFAEGYIGLQAHGGNDRVWYKEIQVKEFAPADIPVNVSAPVVTGRPRVGKQLSCSRGVWTGAQPTSADASVTWYRSNHIGEDHPRFRAPSQLDLGNVTTPVDPSGIYGTQNLTWLDSMVVGHGKTYRATAEDEGKVIHCAVMVDNGGATVWATGSAGVITD